LSNGAIFDASDVGTATFYAKGAFVRPDLREPQNRLTVVFRDGGVLEITGPVALTDAKHLDACGVVVQYEEPPENPRRASQEGKLTPN